MPRSLEPLEDVALVDILPGTLVPLDEADRAISRVWLRLKPLEAVVHPHHAKGSIRHAVPHDSDVSDFVTLTVSMKGTESLVDSLRYVESTFAHGHTCPKTALEIFTLLVVCVFMRESNRQLLVRNPVKETKLLFTQQYVLCAV